MLDSNNLDLIYEYSVTFVNWEKAGVQSLNSRLTMVVVFGGVLLRFAIEVEGVWQRLVCVFVMAGIVAAVLGLRSKPTGILASPETLLNKWYDEDREQCRLYITEGLSQTGCDLNRLRGWKANHLNVAVYAMLMGLAVFAIRVMLGDGKLEFWF